MIWSSLVVSCIITGLVTLTFALLRNATEGRIREHGYRQTITHHRLEVEGVRAAVRHFRHDLGNLLVGVKLLKDQAQAGLNGDAPRQVYAAFEHLSFAVQQSLAVVKEFRPDDPEGDKPTLLDLGHLITNTGKLFTEGEDLIATSFELEQWYVKVRPMATALLVGNLLKNAVEASPEEVCVEREGDHLVVLNPVTGHDLHLLREGSVFDQGVSSKGEGRGTGLESARTLAARCGVSLRYELCEIDDADWVRFVVDFSQVAHRGDPALEAS